MVVVSLPKQFGVPVVAEGDELQSIRASRFPLSCEWSTPHCVLCSTNGKIPGSDADLFAHVAAWQLSLVGCFRFRVFRRVFRLSQLCMVAGQWHDLSW